MNMDFKIIPLLRLGGRSCFSSILYALAPKRHSNAIGINNVSSMNLE